MSNSTDTEIKELIGSVDRKLDLVIQEVSNIKQDVSTIKSSIDKMDNRLWTFGGLILAACLGAFLKALNL
jgi:hypothetical protein